jgi:hypothetical protein
MSKHDEFSPEWLRLNYDRRVATSLLNELDGIVRFMMMVGV